MIYLDSFAFLFLPWWYSICRGSSRQISERAQLSCLLEGVCAIVPIEFTTDSLDVKTEVHRTFCAGQRCLLVWIDRDFQVPPFAEVRCTFAASCRSRA